MASHRNLARRLAFFKSLQGLIARITATENIDQLITDVSEEICDLFGAARLSIYVIDETGTTITAKAPADVSSGMPIRLPISEKSIAGFCALKHQLLNIRNVYNDEELHGFSPSIHFRKDMDERNGFRSKQMLVAPIVAPGSDEVMGVIQLINSLDDEPFSEIEEEGIQALAQSFSPPFAVYVRARQPLQSPYHYLVRQTRISEEDLNASAEEARRGSRSQERVLIDTHGLALREIGESMSQFYGIPYEPYRADRIKPIELLRNIKREYAALSGWLPLEENQHGIVILAIDPERVIGSRVASNVFPGTPLLYRVSTEQEFEQAISQFFDAGVDEASVGDLLSGLDDEDELPTSGTDELHAASENELVKLVNRIIIDAHRQGASDIHIEPRPGKEKTLVRFRKDGSLVPYIEVPAAYRASMLARIKIMCDLDISERRKPQDGKIKFRKFAPLDIELRVATIPTTGGLEDIVMRLLSQGEPIPVDRLALSESNLERLKATITKPYGIFFVCGPTGSGKTTTLHSILKYINTSETKIWTAEDPVEITQRGLRQVQINRKAGLDFPTVMRAFLRADPDVIMVGEMRDTETVSIGLEASLTGHLVLSTLHTNSAPESIVRLLDMGMDPFNFADALLGVLAQRLAKRLCSNCRSLHVLQNDEVQTMLDEYLEDLRKTRRFTDDPVAARAAVLADWKIRFGDAQGNLTAYCPEGCEECSGTGYRGRVGLHELMLGNDNIRRMIQTRALVSDLLLAALDDGMRTLRQDGIEKVLAGYTDMVQVRKVCIR
ncbi:GspE/PulE family protein [Uliginosibacterium gangwonense]|uniref:GspE/PulE family protein n=1 Tax=Uliginosibacterium gangwonense TaxID=392736 RepID=UPI00037567F5|nr:GspE/PulE family protein [Uliginosibacterium gangwonense]